MSADAVLTVLGSKRVQRWTCSDDEEFESACRSEEALVGQLQTKISEQIGHRTYFDQRLLGHTDMPLNTIEPHSLPIGDSDGLVWLQGMVREELEEPPPHDEQIQSLNSIKVLSARNFRHLLEHAPASGLFLPEDFPEPFRICHETDLISVGSLQRLHGELIAWFDTFLPVCVSAGRPVDDGLLVYAQNLKQMVILALDHGLALELF